MPTLYRKLLLLAWLIALFAVGMSALLVTFKVDNTYRELRHSRFELVARDVNRVIEQSFALGLTFNELSALPAVITRRKNADSAIRMVDVASAQGVILYSTDELRVGRVVPTQWQTVVGQQQSSQSKTRQRWRLHADGTNGADDEAVAGSLIVNSFGVLEGYVAVSYLVREGVSVRAQLLHALWPIALITWLVVTLLLFILFALLMRRFEHQASQAADALALAFVDGATPVDQRLEPSWRSIIAPVQQQTQQARAALARWQSKQ